MENLDTFIMNKTDPGVSN